jgi:hypothetical protein
MAMEHIVVVLMDLGQNPIFVPLLANELKTLTPWAIYDIPTHLISTLAWERLVVVDQIQKIWISQ